MFQLLYNQHSDVIHVLAGEDYTSCGYTISDFNSYYLRQYEGQNITCENCYKALTHSLKATMQKQKKVKDKIRVNMSLSKEIHDELNKIAFDCGMTKTSMATEIVEMRLNDETFVESLKEKYAVKSTG